MKNYPNWSCPKKVKAREETILSCYKMAFGLDKIPEDKQYITMCGLSINEDGTPRDKCEFNHMVNCGLIIPEQFIGVEIDEDIHKLNKKVSDKATWICGDLYDTLVKLENQGVLNPAIVNVDLIAMPKRGAEYLSRVLHFLSKVNKNTLVIGNFILRCYTMRSHYQDIADHLLDCPLFQSVHGEWNMLDHAYVYSGASGENRTEMGSVILWRDK